jgi:hypothetical protein
MGDRSVDASDSRRSFSWARPCWTAFRRSLDGSNVSVQRSGSAAGRVADRDLPSIL